MRISAKADYALRATAQLAASPPGLPIKAEQLANAQGIPVKFLLNILSELKHAHVVQSHRGAEGGYALAKPADQISLADVIRAVEGPLANVHESAPEDMIYTGPAEALREIWIAVRASLRQVLEEVSLADLAKGDIPDKVRQLSRDPDSWAAR
jgi:Rrf2 family protein